MRTNQERLSVRLTAEVMARPASPAFTGRMDDTVTAAAKTTVLLMKSILIASHLFMICICKAAVTADGESRRQIAHQNFHLV